MSGLLSLLFGHPKCHQGPRGYAGPRGFQGAPGVPGSSDLTAQSPLMINSNVILMDTGADVQFNAINLSNQPFFRASSPIAPILPSVTVFALDELDGGSNFQIYPSSVQILSAGIYQFHASVELTASSPVALGLEVTISGQNPRSQSISISEGKTPQSWNLSFISQVSAGDFVAVQLKMPQDGVPDGGESATVEGQLTALTIYKLG